ncbi:hypothetical protein GM921_00610 [Pedobacter sp. LMG 31464]|uniref:Uncharacterized protein n=1 Tax=Pedobacter planticolens TaxID=2679964 RepID=A0A923ITP6_9SPHI|nr:hypothetical protein [Pedobacter planticolens]MBB2143971.1 hypothetical protein [Pedobacter planticolens]
MEKLRRQLADIGLSDENLREKVNSFFADGEPLVLERTIGEVNVRFDLEIQFTENDDLELLGYELWRPRSVDT